MNSTFWQIQTTCDCSLSSYKALSRRIINKLLSTSFTWHLTCSILLRQDKLQASMHPVGLSPHRRISYGNYSFTKSFCRAGGEFTQSCYDFPYRSRQHLANEHGHSLSGWTRLLGGLILLLYTLIQLSQGFPSCRPPWTYCSWFHSLGCRYGPSQIQI
jgi:hypothetical protein